MINTIFIADDDPDDVDLYQIILSEVCPKVKLTFVSNGLELVQQVPKSIQPDVVVLDVKLSGFDGLQCLRYLRNIRQLDNMLIVMLTSWVSEKDIQRCRLLGANYFYEKPTRLGDYKSIIDEIKSGSTSYNPYRKFGFVAPFHIAG